ncbi:MAG: 4-(cytidine 5'-diphospho)-2-C-methyl-D-erythritol kinase [Pirellulaceae bacterium]|jgi:4-diphosphocytidyl-2-C-methyl-D-erythritol kinase|nr:4-(cytidine 5'-diphospho)-2-C-methyl-D-erythritol kinase [Pirellulaceae bacterium]MDP7305913.1 4-(cytidine 5'-diphospho)-2-C-methyl-D-erythritol kinase [Pirellulaceae bacterium]HJN07705.1 4-(cytidine 5'-diphospho)-2-C-methyl-D-erythritol kinase [Pirellulaceae bacterium]
MNQNTRGSIRIDCSAKLNLFLEVLGKRDDGFHEIETIMSAVSLYDSLYFFSNSTGNLRLSCQWASGLEGHKRTSESGISDCLGELPQHSDNIVWKAVERLRNDAGIEAGATIRLVKRIPAMAGLGGASSNAAAALLAANRVWQLDWSQARLERLAAELGSDVPFFLANRSPGSAMAVARGRGERIEGLTGMTKLHFVVVRPPTGLSTPRVYGHCLPAEQPASLSQRVRALRDGNPARVGAQLFNRLQSTATELSPWIEKVCTAFTRLDCLGHAMSGSGTSYFGLFRSARHAARHAVRLRATGLGYVFTTRTVTVPCQVAGFRRVNGK